MFTINEGGCPFDGIAHTFMVRHIIQTFMDSVYI